MNYLIGAVVFLFGMGWYLTTGDAVVVQNPRDSHRSSGRKAHSTSDSQGRNGLHGTSDIQGSRPYLPDDGAGWQGPAPGDRLARYARRNWAGLQEELLAGWNRENAIALDEHRMHMETIENEWRRFASARTTRRQISEIHQCHAGL